MPAFRSSRRPTEARPNTTTTIRTEDGARPRKPCPASSKLLLTQGVIFIEAAVRKLLLAPDGAHGKDEPDTSGMGHADARRLL